MTRREAWLSAGLVFLVALVVRAGLSAAAAFPRPEDTAYYVGVARNLLEGRGLVSDAIWSYGTPPLVFPRPAFEVWMPLPSLLFAGPIAILGMLSSSASDISLETAMHGGQVVTAVAGALLAVLAWRLGADVARQRGLPVGRARTLALGAGLAAAVYLPLVLHAIQPDSTILFGLLALGFCLLATRVLDDPRGARIRDPRLLAMGLVLGAAALTRNEAAWLALIWAWLAWRRTALPRVTRVRLVGVVAAVSLAVFAPWAIRNLAVFGSLLPGQAITNALYVKGSDVFAWNDPPTLSRYLAVGPGRLAEMRVEGLTHNLVSVLLLLGIPLSLVGLPALPWQARDRALRPLALLSAVIFLVTALVFPVTTTWGTFLHAAAPVHVLLIISALGALDAGFAALSRRLGWTRPVAWLGALLVVFGSVLFSAALLPKAIRDARDTARLYALLPQALADAGAPLDGSHPVITDFPIWLAETARVPALALPNEPPADVLDLAQDPRFGARWLVLMDQEGGVWPGVLADGDPAASCFTEVGLPAPADPADADLLRGVRLFRIACDGIAQEAPLDPAGRPPP